MIDQLDVFWVLRWAPWLSRLRSSLRPGWPACRRRVAMRRSQPTISCAGWTNTPTGVDGTTSSGQPISSPSEQMRASKLVSEGLPISMAHPVLKVPFDPFLPFLPESPTIAPQPTRTLDPDNSNPFFHWMNPTSYTSDRYNVSYHGSAHSRPRRALSLPVAGRAVR